MSQIMYLQKMPIHPHGRDWKFLGVGRGGGGGGLKGQITLRKFMKF